VPLGAGRLALACGTARNLVVHQVIDPPALDWDLAGPGEIELTVATRAVIRRQVGHRVLVWTGTQASGLVSPTMGA
jgi:hypothetical protein